MHPGQQKPTFSPLNETDDAALGALPQSGFMGQRALTTPIDAVSFDPVPFEDELHAASPVAASTIETIINLVVNVVTTGVLRERGTKFFMVGAFPWTILVRAIAPRTVAAGPAQATPAMRS